MSKYIGGKLICFDAHSHSAVRLLSGHGKAVALQHESTVKLVWYIRDLTKSLFVNTQFELTPIVFTFNFQ